MPTVINRVNGWCGQVALPVRLGEGLWPAGDLTRSVSCLVTRRPDDCPVDPGWAHAYKWDPEPSSGSSRSVVEAAGSQSSSPKAPSGARVQAAALAAPGPGLESQSLVWLHSPGSLLRKRSGRFVLGSVLRH